MADTHPMQSALQPFIKLTQANMELLTRFTTSPEVTSQAADNASNMGQQGPQSAMNLFQSNAFSRLVQGMMKNYVEFMVDCGQNGMALITQGQQAAMRQAQEASSNVSKQIITAASEAGDRRPRQAA